MEEGVFLESRFSLIGALLALLPKRSLTRAAGRLLDHEVSRLLIPWYIRRYSLDLTDAILPPGEYRSLFELFTRRLQPGTRPVDPGGKTVVSPVDGVVGGMGVIHDGTFIQAKGHAYPVADLLGGHFPDELEEGTWITLYLSPADYHRIHLPLRGKPLQAAHIPGTLFPVNRLGTRGVPRLFARNERWVTTFSTAAGTMYLVEIGSFIVGSVRLTYLPQEIQQISDRKILQKWEVSHIPTIGKGEEIGYFSFGSTVVLLFERGRVEWKSHLKTGDPVRMGQSLGLIRELRYEGARV